MKELTVEEKLDQTFSLGIIGGFEQASNFVLDLSVTLFKKDDEAGAKTMKELSKKLLKISQDRKVKYDEYYSRME